MIEGRHILGTTNFLDEDGVLFSSKSEVSPPVVLAVDGKGLDRLDSGKGLGTDIGGLGHEVGVLEPVALLESCT